MSLMKSNPKISIIMPMYRVERYIEKSIRSVLIQDFQDWELLIVNDGSPDNSRKIASKVAACDDRIKILDKENGGLSDARNYGLDRAIGDFIHFFDSDDWIESDFYTTLFNEKEDFDLVVCGYKVDNEKSVTERIGYAGELSKLVATSLHHLVGTYLNFAWNKLFKRSFLVENALYYEKGLYRIEDSEFMMRFLSCKPKVKLIEYSGYHYMVRNTATLSKIFDDRIFDHLSRSISIHLNIFKVLCKDDNIISHQLGVMTLSAIKFVLYKSLEKLPIYKIYQSQKLIKRVIYHDNNCLYITKANPYTIYDKIIVYALKNKNWWFLFVVIKLRKLIH